MASLATNASRCARWSTSRSLRRGYIEQRIVQKKVAQATGGSASLAVSAVVLTAPVFASRLRLRRPSTVTGSSAQVLETLSIAQDVAFSDPTQTGASSLIAKAATHHTLRRTMPVAASISHPMVANSPTSVSISATSAGRHRPAQMEPPASTARATSVGFAGHRATTRTGSAVWLALWGHLSCASRCQGRSGHSSQYCRTWSRRSASRGRCRRRQTSSKRARSPKFCVLFP